MSGAARGGLRKPLGSLVVVSHTLWCWELIVSVLSVSPVAAGKGIGGLEITEARVV